MNNLPTITNRTFGIEMEFVNADPREVARVLNTVVECHFEGYTHRVTDHWKLVTDGSLTEAGYSYSNSGEIVSPILKGADGARQLEIVCNALDTIEGIKVNRHCGLHIHLGVDDLTVAQIQTVYSRYADYEAQIDLVMPRSRRGDSRWAGGIANAKATVNRQTTKRRVAGAVGRYRKVNLTSLTKYGTIEFRHHSATLSFTKIVNWLSFLQAFVEKSIALTSTTRTNTVNKNRPYHQFRTLLENNGYNIEWKRGRNYWQITKDDEYVYRYSNDEINDFYATSRENSFDKNRAIGDLESNCNMNFTTYSAVPRQDAEQACEMIEVDGGWLDGVDQKVKNYFEERQEELN